MKLKDMSKPTEKYVKTTLQLTAWNSVPIRQSTTRNTPQPVMCGALGVSCMRYGVSDISLLKPTPTLK